MTGKSSTEDVRITVRLRGREVDRLDRLVEVFTTRRREFRKPHAIGRHYNWSRGDVVRLALEQLEKAIAASDAIAAAKCQTTAELQERQT